MLVIGLIREGKVPADNRVALTPAQCKFLTYHFSDIKIIVQPSDSRCFSDNEYRLAGIPLQEDLQPCNMLLGIKEVPIGQLLPNKTYLFFSHTKKLQSNNRELFWAMMDKKITLIDYECLAHEDGQRIIGFGFFAGVVGAHNGIMAFGQRTGLFALNRVHQVKDYRQLIHQYFGLKLPQIKVAVTGSGRVSHGIVEIMHLMDVQEVEPDAFLRKTYPYPVYVHLKGSNLYQHKQTGKYDRDAFHAYPQAYKCMFEPYCFAADILMNGVYWDAQIPPLFAQQTLQQPNYRLHTIADITDDAFGSIPCNLGESSIENLVYGVDKQTGQKTLPYLKNSVDVMAVGNLPNELPRDASRFFGEQLIKYVLDDIRKGGSSITQRATMLQNGQLTPNFVYMQAYAAH